MLFAVYEPAISYAPPPGWTMTGGQGGKLFMLAPCWESASYLANSTGGGNPRKKGAATFSYVTALALSAKQGAEAGGLILKSFYAKNGIIDGLDNGFIVTWPDLPAAGAQQEPVAPAAANLFLRLGWPELDEVALHPMAGAFAFRQGRGFGPADAADPDTP